MALHSQCYTQRANSNFGVNLYLMVELYIDMHVRSIKNLKKIFAGVKKKK